MTYKVQCIGRKEPFEIQPGFNATGNANSYRWAVSILATIWRLAAFKARLEHVLVASTFITVQPSRALTYETVQAARQRYSCLQFWTQPKVIPLTRPGFSATWHSNKELKCCEKVIDVCILSTSWHHSSPVANVQAPYWHVTGTYITSKVHIYQMQRKRPGRQ